MEQIPLFDEEFMLINEAASALKELRLDDAMEALQRYRNLYSGEEIDVERKLKIASFLMEGFFAAPPSGPDRPSHLFHLWRSFEEFCCSFGPGGPPANEFLRPFFRKITAAIEENQQADSAFLADRVPVGYAYLQTGEYDRAIRSLQASLIATPDNAAIYGYLGDSYLMRGDQEVARRLYLEACLIDPMALDWRHLRDEQLKDLLENLPEEYDCDPSLAREWLPAYAYIRGFFKPKQIRAWEEFQAFTGGYLALRKVTLETPSPSLTAKMFFKAIVLCDHEPFLRMFQGINFAEIRQEMKTANPLLFAEYLKQIADRRRKGS